MVSKRFQDHACRTLQSLLTRFSAVLTSLPNPQDGVIAKVSWSPQIKKKGTLNYEVKENAFHKMLQVVVPSLDSVYHVQCLKGTTLSEDTCCYGH
jgi:hypothetical protein